jgi:predicted transcriptional regulator
VVVKELEILKALVAHNGNATLNELVWPSGFTRTEVNVILKSLQARGLVEPRYGEEWRLTAKGYEVVEALEKLDREKIAKILRALPNGEGFYFYRDIGQYTGKMASSLSEFHKILDEIEDKSIKFHLDNGDFERWLIHVGDEDLAVRLREIVSSNLEYAVLRSAILEAVGRRLGALTLLQSILG